jgi:DNA-directed RNA polymerase subunit beta'
VRRIAADRDNKVIEEARAEAEAAAALAAPEADEAEASPVETEGTDAAE